MADFDRNEVFGRVLRDGSLYQNALVNHIYTMLLYVTNSNIWWLHYLRFIHLSVLIIVFVDATLYVMITQWSQNPDFFHPVPSARFCCVPVQQNEVKTTTMVCINLIVLYSNSKKRKEREGEKVIEVRGGPRKEGRSAIAAKKFQIKFQHPFSLQSTPSRLHPEPSIYRGSQKSGP